MQQPALKAGDTVTVIGASGNVGKLVALRLADSFNVRGVVRNANNARAFFGDKNVELFEADICNASDADDAALSAALKGSNAIVVCTGTTAFPTKAWSPSESEDVTGAGFKALLDNKFNVKDAIAALDAQGASL
jgi:nucleoside-diphosphate-sugar epimerase